MRTLVLAPALLLCACNNDLLLTGWERAPYTHTCTTEEIARVQTETAWCAHNTDYLSTYCYGTAIMRLCKPRSNS